MREYILSMHNNTASKHKMLIVCGTYSEAGSLSGDDELDVSGYGVLTDTGLHPDVTEFITSLRVTK